MRWCCFLMSKGEERPLHRRLGRFRVEGQWLQHSYISRPSLFPRASPGPGLCLLNIWWSLGVNRIFYKVDRVVIHYMSWMMMYLWMTRLWKSFASVGTRSSHTCLVVRLTHRGDNRPHSRVMQHVEAPIIIRPSWWHGNTQNGYLSCMCRSPPS